MEKSTRIADILYSIVIPIYNEVDNIVPLTSEIERAMHAYSGKWELLFVDDGSTDGSFPLIQTLSETKPYLRCLRFKKNYGQTSAFVAGFRAAHGKWVISLDGDGQNDPRDIPLLIETCENSSYDLVSGKRQIRKDSPLKRLISKTANYVRQKVLADQTKDTGCSLKIYRKECLEQIPLFHGMHRFLPALFQTEGFKTREVSVNHRERQRGKSKYTLFNRGAALFFDMLGVAWMRKRRLRYEIDQEQS